MCYCLLTVGFCEFLQSVSPGAVKTEIAEASDFPKEVLEGIKDIPFLQSKDIADAVIYVLGTPPHVQVGRQYFMSKLRRPSNPFTASPQ
jgi:NADP-dependent 3-hydroxy acid dehydrogenase YdfG